VPVPNWIFEASCDQHDFNYTLGFKEFHRVKADYEFYQAMRRDADAKPWWRRWWYRSMARLYWWAVDKAGGPSFNYSDHEVTREELLIELERLERLEDEADAVT